MRSTGRRRIVALILLALLAGSPGLLQAICPGCQASRAIQGPHCHGEHASMPHSLPRVTCCGDMAWKPAAGCCGQATAAEPSAAIRDAAAPSAPFLAGSSLAAAPATPFRQDETRLARLPASPPVHQGVSLHVLDSVFLI